LTQSVAKFLCIKQLPSFGISVL